MAANTAATSLAEYRANMAERADTIGDMLWFTISGARCTPDELKRWFFDLGLDERYLPAPIKAVDSFRTATSDVTATYDLPADGQTAELMIREVDSNNEMVVRHIMREVRDRRRQVLSYEQVGEAIFYRHSRKARTSGVGSETVRFSIKRANLDSAEQAIVEDFIAKVNARYHDLCANLQSQALRAVIRNYVNDLNAVQLRPSGGLYFVHESRRSTVRSLEELVGRFGRECRFHTVPLPDTAKQREMLTEAFQDEVIKKCEKLLGDIASINERYRGKKVPPGTYAKLTAEYQDVMSRSEEHTRVIGLAQGRAATSLEMALDAVADMAMRVDHTG